jgi:segregation and condensation protein B
MTNLASTIEALLFYLAEPIRVSELAHIFGAERAEIDSALQELRDSLSGRGIRLLEHTDEVSLVTAPEASSIIESVVKEELSKDLSRAALETLSVILYHGPLTRAEIDHIRGVNSTFILRNLMIRGLVEKLDNPLDQRSFLYRATSDTLRFLGISRVEELPGYAETKGKIASILTASTEETNPGSPETKDAVRIIPEPDEFDPSMADEERTEIRGLEANDYESSNEHHAP